MVYSGGHREKRFERQSVETRYMLMLGEAINVWVYEKSLYLKKEKLHM